MTPEQAMISAYQRAHAQLRIQITAAIESGNLGTETYLQAQLASVQRTLNALQATSNKLVIPTAQQPYLQAAHAVDLSLGTKAKAAFSFTGSHVRAVNVLAHNMAVKFGAAIQTVGRRADDAYRRIALEQVAQNVAAGGTRRELSAALKARILQDGVTDSLTGFVDKAGRRWGLDRYTTMVARTTTREAVTAGTSNRMIETGQNLITISDHATTTEICQQYEGNTYALPGTVVEGYDTIDDLPPFHPNCEHVATPAEGNAEAFLQGLEQKAPQPSTAVSKAVTQQPLPAKPPAAPELPSTAAKIGDKVQYKGGVNRIDGTEAKAGKGTIARLEGDNVMLNMGTDAKPRWVFAKQHEIEGLPAKIVKPRTPLVGEQAIPDPLDGMLSPVELRKTLGQDHSTLDAAAKKAVKEYTGDAFYDLNMGLRAGKTPPLTRKLDAAFEQVTPTEKPGLLLRAVQADRLKGGKHIKPGGILNDKGFSSTTVSRKVAEEFTGGVNDLLEIEVPAGARVIDVNNAAGSALANEREILLGRDARFIIIKVTPARPGHPRIIRARLVID